MCGLDPSMPCILPTEDHCKQTRESGVLFLWEIGAPCQKPLSRPKQKKAEFYHTQAIKQTERQHDRRL